MAEIKPLDDLLEHEVVLFNGTNKKFNMLLDDALTNLEEQGTAYGLDGLYCSKFGLKLSSTFSSMGNKFSLFNATFLPSTISLNFCE